MRDYLRKLVGISEPIRRKISTEELKRVKHLTEASGENWSDFSRDISKWIFATLITLGTGGIYLVLTLGLSPGVAAAVLTKLFVSLGVTLLGAVSMLAGTSERIAFADRIVRSPSPNDEIVEEGEVERFLRPKFGLIGPLLCASFSFFMTGLAGINLSENITPCSASDLEYSISTGSNVVPRRPDTRTCYFYEIDGLSNDPLERARQELELIKNAKINPKRQLLEAAKR